MDGLAAATPGDKRRAVRLGVVAALFAAAAQLAVGAAWSLGHDDPTELELTGRCLEREKGLAVEATRDDPVAATARGGTLTTFVEGGLVTISAATSQAEVDRLRTEYRAGGDRGSRLDVHGRYVNLWLREPRRSQLQVTYDCAY